ncbi:MAG: hypothetical protein MRZ79_10375 [Bacteroidia bacterium]|nr:hypothetical protein [Bacteroidia bacterium]
MKVAAFIPYELLKKVCEDKALTLDRKGIIKLCDMISEEQDTVADHRFYYESVFIRVGNLAREGKLNKEIEFRNIDALDNLAKCVGFEDFDSYKENPFSNLSPELKSCIGAWYYYVRENKEGNVLLRSPMKIYQVSDSLNLQVELIGGTRIFTGYVVKKNEALFFHLNDQQKLKQMHFVFKIGLTIHPQVLQGVISAYTSGGVPVAGRAFLVKQVNKKYEELDTQKWLLHKQVFPDTEWEKSIAKILEKPENNYIRVDNGFQMNLEDLE